MNSPSSGVCGLLHTKLESLLAEFDTVAGEMKEQQENDSVLRERFSKRKTRRNFMSTVRSFIYVVKRVKPNGGR